MKQKHLESSTWLGPEFSSLIPDLLHGPLLIYSKPTYPLRGLALLVWWTNLAAAL